MSNQHNQRLDFTEFGYEVRFASFHESDLAGTDSKHMPFYERLAQLGVAGGTHFLRAGNFDIKRDLLVEDYPDALPQYASGRQLREAIVTIADIIHHYIFDIVGDEIVCVTNQMPEGRARNRQTPVYAVAKNDDLSEFMRYEGEDHRLWLGNRLQKIELISDDSAPEKFLADTDLFVSDCRVHVEPAVGSYRIVQQ